MKRFLSVAGPAVVVAATLAVMPLPAAGQAWPTKPITIVVPWPAGGTSDVLARAVGQKLTQATGQTVVIENRPGAAGNLGAAAAAKAPPDGHTLVIGAAAISTAQALYKDPGFRVFESLTPVTMLGTVPFMLVVNPSLPATGVAQFIDYAKQHPDKLSLGSGGSGTIPHLGGELLKKRAGIVFTHVPYKGGIAAIAGLVAGEVQFTIDGGTHVASQIDAGRIRLLAVTTRERLARYPNVPTLAESGYPGYEASAWQMLLVPGGTPKAVVERIQQEVARALHSPDLSERLQQLGVIPSGITPAETEAFLRAEMAKWGEVIRASGAKVD